MNSTVLSALAEPNRLRIVEFLRQGPYSVGEIVDQLGLSQPQVSKHLRVLSEAGLVEVSPMAQQRIYKLRSEPFQELDTWLASYRHFWQERFDRLDQYLQELQGKEKKLVTDKSVAREDLVITRIFDAPREVVFKAWSNPEHLKRWWGPRGFAMYDLTLDFRVGGTIHFRMSSTDGHEVWCKGVYQEIIAPEKIVSTSSFSDPNGNLVQPTEYGLSADWPAEAIFTVIFEEIDGPNKIIQTKLTMHQPGIPLIPEREGAIQGWNESLDKLSESLNK